MNRTPSCSSLLKFFHLNSLFIFNTLFSRTLLTRIVILGFSWVGVGLPVWGGSFYSQFGDVRYESNFSQWSYVNPNAPKGGTLTLVPPTRITQFDKFNPFTLKGIQPPGLTELMFESLLTSNFDEPTTAYGLLAQDVQPSTDWRSVTFVLNPAARFYNGDPVLAKDVKSSYDRLMSAQASPQWQSILSGVAQVVEIDPRTVRFDFKSPSRELPLIVGAMPVFSHRWGAGKPFDQVVLDQPITSGPYTIGAVTMGRDITYQRHPQYWAQHLPVRKGMYNFDRITYKIYKDSTARLEAFKVGEYDYIQAFIAREWARQFTGGKFASGELIKRELPHGNAGDFQGFFFNTRRPILADVRVRQAIELGMDFEWMNRQLFYNAYSRVKGFFPASDFEAKGVASGDELKLLVSLQQRWGKTVLPDAVLTQPVPEPPSTLAPSSLRSNLRQARDLLAQAGWTIQEGVLRNAQGQAFELEFLDDSSGGMSRILTPYAQNLRKLGMQVRIKQSDYALLNKRQEEFDFDIVSARLLGSEAPGSELVDRFSSASAQTKGSNNLIGVNNAAVDALVAQVGQVKTRPELVATLRALDRVLRHGHYVVPQWSSQVHRVAWRAGKFAMPAKLPRFYQPEAWVVQTWWAQANQPVPTFIRSR